MSRNTILEERVEIMVLTPTIHSLQIARFLKPIMSMHAPPPNHPSQTTSTISTLPENLERVDFIGWVKPQPKWKDWVNNIKAQYGAVWRIAGIHDAIMNSVLKFPQNKRLILWFAEKWSPKTNTFVLPWGEITITLEDMMVLGGFSVLGDTVSRPIESTDEFEAYKKLDKAYRKMVRSSSKKATYGAWMAKFMGRGKALEHEAFLALWLSKNLFPSVKNTILKETFTLAIHLARGRKIALAPAVLSTLYRDLHYLRDAILDLQEGETSLQEIFAPMYYVQVWVWERFPSVRPQNMRITQGDETRLARWAKLGNKGTNYETLESGTREEEHFVWRPYLNNTNHYIAYTIYKENCSFERIDECGYNEEVWSFVQCLRVSKLIGLDITQQYFPHRVSKQFGYDQDIPADILQLQSNEDACADYGTSLQNEIIYLPSRHSKGYMTKRYKDWWENGPIAPPGPRIPVHPRRQRRRIAGAN